MLPMMNQSPEIENPIELKMTKYPEQDPGENDKWTEGDTKRSDPDRPNSKWPANNVPSQWSSLHDILGQHGHRSKSIHVMDGR